MLKLIIKQNINSFPFLITTLLQSIYSSGYYEHQDIFNERSNLNPNRFFNNFQNNYSNSNVQYQLYYTDYNSNMKPDMHINKVNYNVLTEVDINSKKLPNQRYIYDKFNSKLYIMSNNKNSNHIPTTNQYNSQNNIPSNYNQTSENNNRNTDKNNSEKYYIFKRNEFHEYIAIGGSKNVIENSLTNTGFNFSGDNTLYLKNAVRIHDIRKLKYGVKFHYDEKYLKFYIQKDLVKDSFYYNEDYLLNEEINNSISILQSNNNNNEDYSNNIIIKINSISII